ncbi:hypothetical protein [Aliiroseovarius crassostreae]|uniref:hypothetical protein n=1 Tax=Aliiroseovarius crassostreae TaxID=154981 RepID=UPI0022033B12|nr:hypothetical protein [Aliiroseovarius crassostreae]UWQ06069.1 hypothetical protein K3X22_06480 [Aliiroseovarius crassostreae]
MNSGFFCMCNRGALRPSLAYALPAPDNFHQTPFGLTKRELAVLSARLFDGISGVLSSIYVIFAAKPGTAADVSKGTN